MQSCMISPDRLLVMRECIVTAIVAARAKGTSAASHASSECAGDWRGRLARAEALLTMPLAVSG
jgi:hypothetical protein